MTPPGSQEAGARVVERGDDVFLEGIIAERLANDDVDALGRRNLGRVHLGDAGIGDMVVSQELAGDIGNLGRLVEVDAGRAELGRQEAEQAGAGADVGNRGLPRDDDALQRRLKGGVADPVRKQRAMILDAHRLDCHGRRDAQLLRHRAAGETALPWLQTYPVRRAIANPITDCPAGSSRRRAPRSPSSPARPSGSCRSRPAHRPP